MPVTEPVNKRRKSTASTGTKNTRALNSVVVHNQKVRDISTKAAKICAEDSEIEVRFTNFKITRALRLQAILRMKLELNSVVLYQITQRNHDVILGNTQAVEGTRTEAKGVKDIAREERQLAEVELTDDEDTQELLAWVKLYCRSDATAKEMVEAIELMDLPNNGDSHGDKETRRGEGDKDMRKEAEYENGSGSAPANRFAPPSQNAAHEQDEGDEHQQLDLRMLEAPTLRGVDGEAQGINSSAN